MSYYIYINGHPGIGKLTIAKELQSRLQHAKIYHNHLMIDPIAPIVDRTSPNYHVIRTSLRRHLLDIIATVEEARPTSWIFTDSRSTSPDGKAAAEDYKNAAAKRGAPFIPIILHCDLEENLQRIVHEERCSEQNTKLRDANVLKSLRTEEKIYSFGVQQEMHLDITRMEPAEAAEAILVHIGKLGQMEVYHHMQ
ncbi:hypothetical protein CMUS01_15702 [Colletotrichum musicola]|uniref:Uncharacterized protein n=1 Tax=Colletotrichum musicola TaxID=2175873 RepID=A0A8H6IU89_9PEZI|nr:hypothetical protein CMUS01_15702 [Colletotrichum musicola]